MIVVNYSHIQEAFEKNPDAFQQAVYNCADQAAGGDAVKRAEYLADWNDALAALKAEELHPDVMSTPRNAIAARLQSLIAETGADEDKCQITRTTGLGADRQTVYKVQFDSHDLSGWLGVAWKRIFKPDTHFFMPPVSTPEPISDQATIAVFGDWGTGLYGAPVVAKSIMQLPRCDVALHLGDTYYSGADTEIATRLTGVWPVRKDTVNRTLNGNHEMYSGGVGYFGALNSFFHQSASCFAMQNTNWILMCLDTAYAESIDTAQLAWLKALVDTAGTRKLILFSHHQPFSYFREQGPNLQKALADLLNAQRIYAWFWGHEHRMVLYDAHSRWGFKGRCIGNGGFPNFRDAIVDPPSMIYRWVDLVTQASDIPAAKLFDGQNFWVVEDPMKYGPHGFMTLEFDGDKVYETYKAPDGVNVMEKILL